jgi:hypothetical protein
LCGAILAPCSPSRRQVMSRRSDERTSESRRCRHIRGRRRGLISAHGECAQATASLRATPSRTGTRAGRADRPRGPRCDAPRGCHVALVIDPPAGGDLPPGPVQPDRVHARLAATASGSDARPHELIGVAHGRGRRRAVSAHRRAEAGEARPTTEGSSVARASGGAYPIQADRQAESRPLRRLTVPGRDGRSLGVCIRRRCVRPA